MDTSTLLNPPRIDWEHEWDSLGSRVVQVQRWQQDHRRQMENAQPGSGVADQLRVQYQNQVQNEPVAAALARELAEVEALHAHIPGFAVAQIRHINALLEGMNNYRLRLRQIFGWHFKQKLTRSRRYSPSFVNRTLLRQVTTDLRIAEQAVSQRLPHRDAIPWQGHLLYLSDLMAYDALQPLKAAGIVPQETTILTYMQRQTDIRLVPYYNAVLLGFPSATANKSTTPPSEFLAIPHEIGHYLYRHGTLDRIPNDAHALLTKLADAFHWPQADRERLKNDASLIQKLNQTLRARNAGETTGEAMGGATDQESVRQIHAHLHDVLTAPTPKGSASSQPFSSNQPFSFGQIQHLLWQEPITLMHAAQEALPNFDTPDQRHKITLALHQVLHDAMGINAAENPVENPVESPVESPLDVGQLRGILNKRMEDILRDLNSARQSGPDLPPGTSIAGAAHRLVNDYLTWLHGEAAHDAPLAPPQLRDLRRVLTPRANQALAQRLDELHILPTDWRRQWVEELFCDAYGCLIAGPINVLGFQILLSDEQYELEHAQRGKHPVSSLRPFLLSEMLREMQRRGTATYVHAPDLLDRHWQYHLAQYGVHDQQHDILQTPFTPEGQTPALSGREIVDALQIVIDQIFDLFVEIFHTGEAVTPSGTGTSHRTEKQLTLPWQPWTHDITDADVPAPNNQVPVWQAMQALQTQFDAYYIFDESTPEGANSQAGGASTPQAQPQIALQETVNRMPPAVDNRPTAAQLQAQTLAESLPRHDRDNPIPVAEWFRVFAAEGWSTEGPRGSAVDP